MASATVVAAVASSSVPYCACVNVRAKIGSVIIPTSGTRRPLRPYASVWRASGGVSGGVTWGGTTRSIAPPSTGSVGTRSSAGMRRSVRSGLDVDGRGGLRCGLAERRLQRGENEAVRQGREDLERVGALDGMVADGEREQRAAADSCSGGHAAVVPDDVLDRARLDGLARVAQGGRSRSRPGREAQQPL